MSTLGNIATGAVGGLAGGLAMLMVRTVGIESDIIQETLPDKYERGIERLLGFAGSTDAEEEKQLAVAEHLVLSAGLGAGYGAVRGLSKSDSLPVGIAFAAAVYFLMVGVAGPLLGVTRPPWAKPARSVIGEVLNHMLFGNVTAIVSRRLRR
jgi:uncharacterized membrane protein YagU involved in acid resistance